ncbi:MAG: polysaccharide export protein [Magnetococcales bacterium]|nr:polysaccharide export protein [Magnetococcales bacterium]
MIKPTNHKAEASATRLIWLGVMVVLLLGWVNHSPVSAQTADSLQSTYRLGPGDKIRIVVDDEPEMTLETKVSAQGKISFPFLGEVHVAKLTAKEVEEKLIERLQDGYLLHPVVAVTVSEYRIYYVHGEVENPGGYPFEPGLTVRKAIVLAGGFTDLADEQRITVIRGDDPDYRERTINLNQPVFPGDIITIMESFW